MENKVKEKKPERSFGRATEELYIITKILKE